MFCSCILGVVWQRFAALSRSLGHGSNGLFGLRGPAEADKHHGEVVLAAAVVGLTNFKTNYTKKINKCDHRMDMNTLFILHILHELQKDCSEKLDSI